MTVDTEHCRDVDAVLEPATLMRSHLIMKMQMKY